MRSTLLCLAGILILSALIPMVNAELLKNTRHEHEEFEDWGFVVDIWYPIEVNASDVATIKVRFEALKSRHYAITVFFAIDERTVKQEDIYSGYLSIGEYVEKKVEVAIPKNSTTCNLVIILLMGFFSSNDYTIISGDEGPVIFILPFTGPRIIGSDILELQEKNEELSELCSQLQHERDSLKSELDNLTKEYDDMKAEYDELNEEYNNLLSDYQDLTKEFQELQSEYARLQDQYERLSLKYNRNTHLLYLVSGIAVVLLVLFMVKFHQIRGQKH